MIATLNTTRVLLTLPGHARRLQPPGKVRWIGASPHQPTPRARVLLADGVWIILERRPPFTAPEWTKRGLCSRLPTKTSDAMFFGVERRAAPGALIAAANTARQLCAQCPVSATCLTHALVMGERYGVWGGTSGRQRIKLRQRLESGAHVDELVAECLPARVRA